MEWSEVLHCEQCNYGNDNPNGGNDVRIILHVMFGFSLNYWK